jgi:cell wall-associated NlpC family hydrolase
MALKRLTVVAALASVLFLSGSLQAKTATQKAHSTHHSQGKTRVHHGRTGHHAKTVAHSKAHAHASPGMALGASSAMAATAVPPLLNLRPLFSLSPVSTPEVGSYGMLLAHADKAAPAVAVAAGNDGQASGDADVPAVAEENITDLRKALIALAMKLRDTRYVRGGHDPSTGFDCSGFVRYVFAHAVGMQLPTNSAAQFLAGLKVKRADMKPGDLVFFHTHGKRRISHVGIYISNGRFIHSPTTGKSVEISSLNSGYWAKRFAGAKRPEAMAQVASKG